MNSPKNFIALEENLSTIKEIINESKFLSKVTEDIDYQELIEFIYSLPNIKNFDNIIKFYKHNYDFNNKELMKF